MIRNTFPILIIPGYANSGPSHWQTLWEKEDSHCMRVQQRDWKNPVCSEWIETLDRTIKALNEPPILVAHSLGCAMVIHWANQYSRKIRGALLVAPPDIEAGMKNISLIPIAKTFHPVPLTPLPFKSIVVASQNDTYCTIARSKYFAECWGSQFVDVGLLGHINDESNVGAWERGKELLFTFKNR